MRLLQVFVLLMLLTCLQCKLVTNKVRAEPIRDGKGRPIPMQFTKKLEVIAEETIGRTSQKSKGNNMQLQS